MMICLARPGTRTCLACKTAGQALFAVFFAPPSPRLTEPTTLKKGTFYFS